MYLSLTYFSHVCFSFNPNGGSDSVEEKGLVESEVRSIKTATNKFI